MKPLLLPFLLLSLPLAAAAQDTKSAGKAVTQVNADVALARRAEAEKRYADAEAILQKDINDHPELAIPRVELGLVQLALQRYDAAAASFRHVLGLDKSIDSVTHDQAFYQDATPQTTHASRNTAGGEYIAEKNRDPEVIGAAWNGLGEIYIHQKDFKNAEIAYDNAAQANPAKAGFYRSNETILFFKAGQSEVQLTSAEKAIAADPAHASNYYFKAQALVSKATMDNATGKMILPPGCAEAYQKYLQLDPNGQFSADAKGILTAAGLPIPKKS